MFLVFGKWERFSLLVDLLDTSVSTLYTIASVCPKLIKFKARGEN